MLPTALVSAHLETAAPGSPTASEDYGDRTVRADRAQLLGDDTGSWNAPAAAPPAAEDYGDRTVQATRAQLFGDDTDSRRPDPEPNPSAVTFPAQDVNGLFGERLTIAVSAWIDPADEVLTTAGYRLDDGERAVLVCTDLHNAGPIDYESLPDLYLELVADDGRRLTKAAISVAGHPAHRVGVPAGSTSSGWTVFLIPTDERASAIQWSVRPDLADRTVRWDLPGRS